MTSVNRSESPILKSSNKRKVAEMVLTDGKIHRIRLISDAVCTLANIVSPNCIWFKLRNNIAEELQCVKPSPLEKLQLEDEEDSALELYKYVLSPLNDTVYARARIMGTKKTKKDGELVKVHFIDEGYSDWMNADCLAKMEPVLYTHPWQAIPVALFKTYPGLDFTTLEEYTNWADDTTQVLAKILGEYTFFRVSPIQNSDRLNNYYEYIRADVFGLASEDDKVGESIAHRLAMEMFSIPKGQISRVDYFHRSWFDAKEQPLLSPTDETFSEELASTIPMWRKCFPEDFGAEVKRQISIKAESAIVPGGTTEDGEEPAHSLWDPDCPEGMYPNVRSATLQYLTKKKYCEDKKCIICIEWKSVKSPYEFYGFPMMKGEADPIQNFYEEQLKWASTLDSFYGHPSNRKPIDGQVVMQMLRDESHPQVYAIYEFNDEVVSGSYRRVHVLAVRNPKAIDYSGEFCRIRFLDVGGNDIVPLAGLIAIHSSHGKKPPMCLQLSTGRIVPKDGGLNWSEKACRAFRKLARSDMPVECEFVRQVPPNLRNNYTDPPQTWPDVVEISNLRVDGMDASIEEEMIENDYATHCSS